MRIAQVAPLYESVPPRLYGATERVVSYLTEELVRQGHQVTLFASGDSRTAAELVPVWPRGLWRDPSVWETLAHHVRQMELVVQNAPRFDVVHFHGDPLHYPLARRLPCRHVTTLHGRLLPVDHGPLFRAFAEAPLVSISDDQRRPLPGANWQATVYHGLPRDRLTFRERPGDYLVFLGRLAPEKRPELAVEIARRAGRELKIAAKVNPGDRDYFGRQVEPLLHEARSFVEYLGEVGDKDKDDLLGGALALVFPIDWPEPFGLVVIEALACGTPVIAFRRGAVPEILTDGVTGFVVDSLDEAVRAVGRVPALSRRACRQAFEERFTDTRMAQGYLDVYLRLLREGGERRTDSAPGSGTETLPAERAGGEAALGPRGPVPGGSPSRAALRAAP
jgi:glycosyltransferase involved in cell wall biosynthesis